MPRLLVGKHAPRSGWAYTRNTRTSKASRIRGIGGVHYRAREGRIHVGRYAFAESACALKGAATSLLLPLAFEMHPKRLHALRPIIQLQHRKRVNPPLQVVVSVVLVEVLPSLPVDDER